MECSYVPPKPVYSPLATDRQEIRLLTVVSGDFEADLRLNLHTALLEDHPIFIALSYCWGDPHDLVEITLNEQNFLVTRNLETALRFWRSTWEDLVIWVDALCINQRDMFEKSSQIGMMAKIYASGGCPNAVTYMNLADCRLEASHVRVWLGEDSSDSNIGMDFLERIDRMDFESPGTKVDSATAIALKKLLMRPWWTRLWVMQEALLAKELYFCCGRRTASVYQFIRFQKEFLNALVRWDALPHLQAPRDHNSGTVNTLLWNWEDYRAQIQRGGISLSQMILVTKNGHYSVSLDRIFALLSVCSERDQKLIPVDYTMSMRELNILVTKYFMVTMRASQPLYCLQFHKSGKDASLPSWVSDFTTSDEEDHLIAQEFAAGADNYAWANLGLSVPSPFIGSFNSLDVVFENEGGCNTLVVPGLVMDETTAVFEVPWIDLYRGFDVAEEQERGLRRRKATAEAAGMWWRHVQALPPNQDAYAETCGRYDAFWRTLILNHAPAGRGPVRAEMGFADMFDAWTGWRSAQPSDGRFSTAYSERAVFCCMWRAFLLTKRGYFSLGSRKARVGDLLCILRGNSVPYVLRPCGDGYYTLVGAAYVHGVMGGSFVREAKEEDVKTFRIR